MSAHSEKKGFPVWGYKLLILLAAVIWGLSFVIMKDTVEVMKPCWIIGIRFLICGIVFFIIFFKRFKATWGWHTIGPGIVLGILMFLAYYAQTEGIANTSPGTNAFLTAVYVVLVPFLWWIAARKRPTVFNVVAAVICVAGIGVVCKAGMGGIDVADDGSLISYGDGLTLVAAVFFAIHIVYVSKVSPGRDVLVLTGYQFFFQGLIAIIVAALVEPFPAFEASNNDFLFNMAYLIVFASCLALCFHNIGLANVPPAQGSIFLSLEAVFGVFFSVVLYGEQVTPLLLVGFALIFVAILASEAAPGLFGKRRDSAGAEQCDSAGADQLDETRTE